MKFRLSSKFGIMEEVRGGRPHSGIDLAMPEGTELRSLFNGTIDKIFHDDKLLGNGVSVKLEDGTRTIYGHMSDVNVSIGDKVKPGDLIGESGNTGLSTGPHLHFGMKDPNGEVIDPSNYAESLAEISGTVTDPTVFSTIFKPTTPWGDYLIGSVKGKVRENSEEMTKEIVLGILEGLADILLEVIGALTLVGGGILIIMKIAGYDKGFKWAGILFVTNVLVKYLLGGTMYAEFKNE